MGEAPRSALFETILLPLVKQIGLCTSQVDDLRAAIAVLLLDGAFFAVEGIGDSHSSTDHTTPFIRTIVTLIADADHSVRSEINVKEK